MNGPSLTKRCSPCVLDSLSCLQAAMSLLFSSRCAIYPHSAPSFIRISALSQKRRDSSPVSHRKTTQQTEADVFFSPIHTWQWWILVALTTHWLDCEFLQDSLIFSSLLRLFRDTNHRRPHACSSSLIITSACGILGVFLGPLRSALAVGYVSSTLAADNPPAFLKKNPQKSRQWPAWKRLSATWRWMSPSPTSGWSRWTHRAGGTAARRRRGPRDLGSEPTGTSAPPFRSSSS